MSPTVHELIDGTYRQTNLPNESAEYLAKREELRLAELDLMRQRERVAELRRHLPQGALVEDYVFEEGPGDLDAGDTPVRAVRLSELFSAPNRSLVIYHFMYGKRQTRPCPMCSGLIDGLNGIAHHVAQNADLAIVAAADPKTLRAHARARGWDNLRLLSCGANTFKYHLGSEDPEGNQDSTVSVFTRDHDGTVRHFYSAHPKMAPDVDERGLDLIFPIWHVLDLTPQGRGNWYASLDYGTKVRSADDAPSSEEADMPERRVKERARRLAREGKSPSTQAGEFVHEEIEHVREGKHGAQSTKQAIAIGLSKARRAGVKLPVPRRGEASESTRRRAVRDLRRSHERSRPSARRSRATTRTLRRKRRSTASHQALSRQAHAASRKRSAASRSAAARKAARTKGPRKRSTAARKAARTRATHS